MIFTLEKTNERSYRFLLKNRLGEIISAPHIDDFWDTEFPELYNELRNSEINEVKIELKVYKDNG